MKPAREPKQTLSKQSDRDRNETRLRKPAPRAPATLRRVLVLALFAATLLGLLDLIHILRAGDLVTAGFLFRYLGTVIVTVVLAGGGVLALAASLPGQLSRALRQLIGALTPRPWVEVVLILITVVLVAGVVPLQRMSDQTRLSLEMPVTSDPPAGGIAEADPSVVAGSPGAGPAKNPNVILVVLDTVRADHLSLYGYERETTPSLVRRKDDFIQYTRAISSAPWTVPAHATIFTGLYPARHGARLFLPETLGHEVGNVRGLSDRLTTLAEILGGGGYCSAAVVSNPYLQSEGGFAQGFDWYRHRMNGNYRLQPRFAGLFRLLFEDRWKAVFDKPQQSADQITRRTIHTLEQLSCRPFFLFVNYMDAHLPFHAPPPFAGRFPGRSDNFSYTGEFETEILGRRRPMSPEERNHLHAIYDASILFIDHHLEHLFQWLESRDLYDQSLIVVVSDHGEFFGEHQLVEHSKDVYEGVLHVPLLIKYPAGGRRRADVRSGQETTPVNLVDLMPTMLSAAGAAVPPDLPGCDLSIGFGARPLLAESYYALMKDLVRPYGQRFMRVRRALYLDNWKYIHSSDGKHELYDLETDPGELENVLVSHPEKGTEFLYIINGLVQPDKPVTGRELEELDEETKARLRALGYL